MTEKELSIVQKHYLKFIETIQEQDEYYLKHSAETPCKITLDLFFRSKRFSLDIISSSMSALKCTYDDSANFRRILRQLTQLRDVLNGERSATRVERRRSALCAEYDKLVINSIRQTKAMIDVLARYA